ncbi:uncharacterized protein LOC109790060 isoform X2 [Cajanus cajan]|uniref:uncharacterized protein LOC109790060 isoform X2 n=1 Tax=Cajanus cajan TaxID=3821 RepID=UPI0010FB63EB|nr:uncharacterized protein LOC109790060 isoform X2 [Cajanus cajan]
MANDTGSTLAAEKGPVTRSCAATPNRKSERLEKRTPPSLAVRNDQKKKTPSSLRRSERTRNGSPSASSDPSPSKSSGSKRHCIGKRLAYEANDEDEDEDEERDVEVEASAGLTSTRTNARVYRTFFGKSNRGCREKTSGVDRSSQEGDDGGGSKIDGDKIDECLKGNCLDSADDYKDILPPEDDVTSKDMRVEPELSGPVKEVIENNVTVNSLALSNAATSEPSETTERVQLSNAVTCETRGTTERIRSSNAASCETERVQSDSCKEETSQMLGSTANENLIKKCVEHDKGEKSLSSKRKITTVDMHSDASAILVDNDNNNMIEKDAPPSRICGNVVETSGSCSKRIRRISLSDVKRDWRKPNYNVDQPSSKSNGEKSSTRNKEADVDISYGSLTPSGSDSERPQGSTVETEKIRKQQRSLHLLLKPEIANLCEILGLPVRSLYSFSQVILAVCFGSNYKCRDRDLYCLF